MPFSNRSSIASGGLLIRTSARNPFKGRVQTVRRGAVHAEIGVTLENGENLVAIITNGSVDALGLQEGKEVHALIKASFVLAAAEGPVRTRARNSYPGLVTACRTGAVNGEVTIGLTGGLALTATITNESIRALGLKVGVPATGIVKASSVILALEG